jgi:Fe-S cluster assembly iron-binding protein IscA
MVRAQKKDCLVFAPQRSAIWLILLVAPFSGCSTNVPNPQAKKDLKPHVKPNPIEEKPMVVQAGIKITPAAKAQIARIAATDRRIRVRMDFSPVGTSDISTKLTVERGELVPGDLLEDCGGIDCLFPKEHFPLAQGAVIDWSEKEKGFAVSFPNKTKENKDKSTYWMWAEFERRSKQKMAEDKANGRLAQRIVDFRKLVADDPENVLGHYRLGQLLAADGQIGEAVKSFERALEISPDFPPGYRYLGECLIRLGKKDRAVEVLTKGWRVAQDHGEEYPRDAMAKLLASVGAPVPKKK